MKITCAPFWFFGGVVGKMPLFTYYWGEYNPLNGKQYNVTSKMHLLAWNHISHKISPLMWTCVI